MEDQPASQPISIESDSLTTIIVNMAEITTSLGSASGTGSGSGSGSVSVGSVATTEERTNDSGVHWMVMCLDKISRKVTFAEGVVDNELLNRRKSKCCCIYRKPHVFDESSSSSNDECEHCCGHPEVRLRNRLRKRQHQTQQQQQKQQQQKEPESKVRQCKYPCGCHGQQAAATQEESAKNTDVAGDSGSLMTKTEL